MNLGYKTTKSSSYQGESNYTIRIFRKTKQHPYFPGEEEVGHIHLCFDYHSRNGNKIYRTHSYVESEYRGRGFGSYLYSLAGDLSFKKGFRLKSTTCPSEYAQRTWNSKKLRCVYDIRKHGGVYEFRSKLKRPRTSI